MPYRISITAVALPQLRSLSARDQRIVEAAVAARLAEQPSLETNAVRRLRPNPLAEFELRVQHFRVLYNIDVANQEVVLVLVGVKVGNKLIVAGEEFHGHRSDPPQSPPE